MWNYFQVEQDIKEYYENLKGEVRKNLVISPDGYSYFVNWYKDKLEKQLWFVSKILVNYKLATDPSFKRKFDKKVEKEYQSLEAKEKIRKLYTDEEIIELVIKWTKDGLVKATRDFLMWYVEMMEWLKELTWEDVWNTLVKVFNSVIHPVDTINKAKEWLEKIKIAWEKLLEDTSWFGPYEASYGGSYATATIWYMLSDPGKKIRIFTGVDKVFSKIAKKIELTRRVLVLRVSGKVLIELAGLKKNIVDKLSYKALEYLGKKYMWKEYGKEVLWWRYKWSVLYLHDIALVKKLKKIEEEWRLDEYLDKNGKIKMQEHHFLSNKNDIWWYTEEFNRILKDYNLNLNDDWNKWLVLPHAWNHKANDEWYHKLMITALETVDEITDWDRKELLFLMEKINVFVVNNAEEVLNGKYKWVVIDRREAEKIVNEILNDKIK